MFLPNPGLRAPLIPEEPENSPRGLPRVETEMEVSNSVITPKSAIPYRNGILVLSYIREYDMECGVKSAM